MRDITPKAMRCHVGESCDSIHELDDGRLMIVGSQIVSDEEYKYLIQNRREPGPTEQVIIIDRALLVNVLGRDAC